MRKLGYIVGLQLPQVAGRHHGPVCNLVNLHLNFLISWQYNILPADEEVKV